MVQLLGKEVGPAGYGMMGLTWRHPPPPKAQSLGALKAALSAGATFWNGGELYAATPDYNSLHLLHEYFGQHPEDAEKVVLSIKGGLDEKLVPDGSEQGIRRSIDNCLSILGGRKKIDLFEAARVDPNVPLETTLRAIQKYVDEGKVGGVALSEVSAQTIRKAAEVVKIAAVEVEFSIFAPDILANGVAQACAELGIPIVAYSPIGRGFLSGEIKKPEDIPENDIKRHLPKYQGEAFENNIKLVHITEEVAKKKGVTPAQVAIAWVKAYSGRNGLGPIIPIPGATTEKRIAENYADVTLSEDEINEIDEGLKKVVPIGERYGGPGAKFMNG